MVGHVEGELDEFIHLLKESVSFDHALRLWRYSSEVADHGEALGSRSPKFQNISGFVRENTSTIVRALDRTFDSPLCGVQRRPTSIDPFHPRRVMPNTTLPREARLLSLLEAEEQAVPPAGEEIALRRITEIFDAWRRGDGDKEASADLVLWLEHSSRWSSQFEGNHDLVREWFRDSSCREDYEAIKKVLGVRSDLFERDEVEAHQRVCRVGQGRG